MRSSGNKVRIHSNYFENAKRLVLKLKLTEHNNDIRYLLFAFKQLSKILKDPESSSNDKFVALELLKNACIAAGMVLPGCQDTGTAICQGKSFRNS